MSEQNNRIVIRAKINYPALFIPKSIKGSPAKYSACLLIPKDDQETIKKYQEALEAAYAAGEKKLSTGMIYDSIRSGRSDFMIASASSRVMAWSRSNCPTLVRSRCCMAAPVPSFSPISWHSVRI